MSATSTRSHHDPAAPSLRSSSVPTRAHDGRATPSRARRGPLDRLARRVLLLRDAEPRALFDLQGSLVLSCIRCILTYVLIPLALPLVGWADVVATPLALVLSVVAGGMAVRSLRRVWQAEWRYRWAYTGFIVVVVALLAVGIGFDVAQLA
jgi:hypothetical protein